jgi:hypothetical protein
MVTTAPGAVPEDFPVGLSKGLHFPRPGMGDPLRPTVGPLRPWRPHRHLHGSASPIAALRSQPRGVIVRRWFGVRPVSELAALTRDPVDPPATSVAVEDERDQDVLGFVLRPLEVGGHLAGRGHDRRRGVGVPGLGHQGRGITAELRQLAGRPQEHSEVVVGAPCPG